MKDDLTYSKNFADFLGSFWSSIFDKGEFASALGECYSEVLVQGYMDLVDIINSTSVNTIPVFSRKNVYPVFLLRSDFDSNLDTPEYGDGSYYGLQPNNSKYLSGDIIRYGTASKLNKNFYSEIPSKDISKLGSIAINRLFEPSVTYLNGVDFSLYKNGVLFRKNPFLNPLIPKRRVINPVTGEIDEEIVLWFCDVDIDTYNIYQQYGYTFTNLKTSSDQYKEITKKLFELVSKGPSVFLLGSYFSVISGSPLIRETSEIVEKIQEDGPSGTLVITNYNVYKIQEGQQISKSIKQGSVLRSGTPLIDVIEIIDTRNKNWWTNFSSLPLPKKCSSNVQTYISFPNKYIKIVYGKRINKIDPLSKIVQFDLIGDKKIIKHFWDTTAKKAELYKQNYGFNLFNKYANYENNELAFSQNSELMINPAQIFSDDFFMGNVLPIKINVNKIKDKSIFFGAVNPIKDNTPVNVILMLFFELDQHDEYNLMYRDGEKISSSVNLDDLIFLNTQNFPDEIINNQEETKKQIWFDYKDETGLIEAISIDVNPSTNKKAGRFNKDNFNSSDVSKFGFLLEKFDLSSTNNLVQNIEIKQIPKCVIL